MSSMSRCLQEKPTNGDKSRQASAQAEYQLAIDIEAHIRGAVGPYKSRGDHLRNRSD